MPLEWHLGVEKLEWLLPDGTWPACDRQTDRHLATASSHYA